MAKPKIPTKEPHYEGSKKYRTSNEVWKCGEGKCRRYASHVAHVRGTNSDVHLCPKHIKTRALETCDIGNIRQLKEYRLYLRDTGLWKAHLNAPPQEVLFDAIEA